MRSRDRDIGERQSGIASVLKVPVRQVIGSLVIAGLFSGLVNLLMLSGPLFMLQVYERVLPSKSVATLVALFALVAVLMLFMAIFDFVRVRVISRAGFKFDDSISGITHNVGMMRGSSSNYSNPRLIDDVTNLRRFFCTNGPASLLDLPWVPFYLGIVFLLHPWLGTLACAGLLFVGTMTIIQEIVTRKFLAPLRAAEAAELRLADTSNNNADTIVALGMAAKISDLWRRSRATALITVHRTLGVSELFSITTKSIRLFLQSAILGLGAFLVIRQEISPGAMIVASLITARGFAPIDQLVGNWKTFVQARQSFERLNHSLRENQGRDVSVTLPQPVGRIVVSGVTKLVLSSAGTPDPHAAPILQGVSFELEPGDGLGVIGPTASGKSSLARLLVGIWTPDFGTIRIDDAQFNQWNPDRLGRYMGYLPQEVQLFPGTILQNIARFDENPDQSAVFAAARMAGVHEMILLLPRGYDAQIGQPNFSLSGGQAQRIALARAVYRCPPLVVLDEPNANLDAEGEASLTSCISALRDAGSTVVVTAHRPSALLSVNRILLLRNGKQQQFGTKENMMKKNVFSVQKVAS